MVAGASRLRDAALGDAQERKLEHVFQHASAAMLTELAGTELIGEDRELLALLREQFTTFFEDQEVGEKVMTVALSTEPETLPAEWLHERFESLGFDPDTFLVGFEHAMAVYSFRLAELLKEEASSDDSPLHNYFTVAKLQSQEKTNREILRRTEPTGPTATELERESWARCKRRWTLLGVPPEEAEAMAKNPTVGAPGRRLREKLNKPVVVLVAEVGSGKSLLLDRLLQRAIVRYREGEDTPLPVFVEAAEVEGKLRDAVVAGASSLGKPNERGAAVFVDGLEEAGREKAQRLLNEAHYLPEIWANTTVVASRPMQELKEEKEHGEAFELPELNEGETEALIRRFSRDDRVLGVLIHHLPESVREAVKRPLFATLVGLDMRNLLSFTSRSVGELLSHIVERALKRADETVDLKELRDLAVMITDTGKGYVRAADAGTGIQVRQLRRTGLVHEQGDALRFSMQILSEWFAAQALELGEVDAKDLASDFARLERWRYPLVMAVGNFGHERVLRIFEPIVQSAPAFASQIVDATFITPRRRVENGVREDVEDVANRLRRAMGAWVEGLGPLAPLSAPVRDDGSLGTLAIFGREGKGDYAWYVGPAQLPDVVPFTRTTDTDLILRGWRSSWRGGFKIERQAAWVWRNTYQELRHELQEVLKAGKLPAVTPMLAKEAAWRTAKDILSKMKGRRHLERWPVEIDEIEGYLKEMDAWDKDWIRMAPPGINRVTQKRFYEVRHLVEEVRRLSAAGETEMASPVPIWDLTSEEAREKIGEDGPVYGWDLYSDERLLERARIVAEEALQSYAEIIETIFLQLAPHMPMAATLPARLVGHLELRIGHLRSPDVHFYLDPLPTGERSVAELRLDTRTLWDEWGPYLRHRIAALRPEAAGWLPPISRPIPQDPLLDLTPVTRTVHYWLWNDLENAKWTERMNPWAI